MARIVGPIEPPPPPRLSINFEEHVVIGEDTAVGAPFECLDFVACEEAFFWDGDTLRMSVISDTFDMGYRGLKFLGWVELAMSESTEDVYVRLYYRNSKNDSWSESPDVKVNDEGAAYFGISAVEFRVKVWANQSEGNNLDSISVRWNRIDNRTVRGVYGVEA